tara:strand:- start:97 stop:324 length:228 start_codon:yes stop_codon:yes gene_type:complete
MNNYELARQLRNFSQSDYRKAASVVERSRVDIGSYFLRYKKLPFRGININVVRSIEKLISSDEELEPDPRLLLAC